METSIYSDDFKRDAVRQITVRGYRQSFRSLRSAKATLSGLETIRTIKRGHIHDKQPGVLGEIAFIGGLFSANA